MAINYKNYAVSNIGTVATTVYNPTTSGIQSTIIGLNMANTSAFSITASVTLTSGATTVYLVKDAEIPKSNSLNIVSEGKIVVEANDVIQVVSSTASSVDVLVSVVEVA